MRHDDWRTGNKHARRQVQTFDKLVKFGDRGREALCSLMEHPDAGVRITSATWLLRYKTQRALAVLREVTSSGPGLRAFEASESIKRWEQGGPFELDPEPVSARGGAAGPAPGASTTESGAGRCADARIDRLVEAFVESVLVQGESSRPADWRPGNKYARQRARAFEGLEKFGDRGLDAFSGLMAEPVPDLRWTAAGYLLPYRTRQALAVLREVARGTDRAAVSAGECRK